MRWPDRPLTRQRQRRHSGSANLLLPTARRAGQDLASGFAEAHDGGSAALKSHEPLAVNGTGGPSSAYDATNPSASAAQGLDNRYQHADRYRELSRHAHGKSATGCARPDDRHPTEWCNASSGQSETLGARQLRRQESTSRRPSTSPAAAAAAAPSIGTWRSSNDHDNHVCHAAHSLWRPRVYPSPRRDRQVGRRA